MSAFSTKRGFVTVRLDESLDMDSVVRRWDQNSDLLKFGPRALIYGLLDEMVDDYFGAVQSLDDAIEGIEDLLFDENAGSAREVSRTTYTLRRSLVQVRRAILPMREVVNTIMRRATADDRAPELSPYYDDLYDHILRASEWTESLRDMITSIFETNMQLSDTRMNTIMKKLTSWAAIIAVPTAVTGFFGQNVPYPGFGQHWGFWLSVVVMIAHRRRALRVVPPQGLVCSAAQPARLGSTPVNRSAAVSRSARDRAVGVVRWRARAAGQRRRRSRAAAPTVLAEPCCEPAIRLIVSSISVPPRSLTPPVSTSAAAVDAELHPGALDVVDPAVQQEPGHRVHGPVLPAGRARAGRRRPGRSARWCG